MGLEVVRHHREQPLQYCNSAAMPVKLLDLGRFILDRLEFFSDEEACALSHHLKRWCGIKLVVLSAEYPRLLFENCVYLGEYYPVKASTSSDFVWL